MDLVGVDPIRLEGLAAELEAAALRLTSSADAVATAQWGAGWPASGAPLADMAAWCIGQAADLRARAALVTAFDGLGLSLVPRPDTVFATRSQAAAEGGRAGRAHELTGLRAHRSDPAYTAAFLAASGDFRLRSFGMPDDGLAALVAIDTALASAVRGGLDPRPLFADQAPEDIAAMVAYGDWPAAARAEALVTLLGVMGGGAEPVHARYDWFPGWTEVMADPQAVVMGRVLESPDAIRMVLADPQAAAAVLDPERRWTDPHQLAGLLALGLATPSAAVTLSVIRGARAHARFPTGTEDSLGSFTASVLPGFAEAGRAVPDGGPRLDWRDAAHFLQLAMAAPAWRLRLDAEAAAVEGRLAASAVAADGRPARLGVFHGIVFTAGANADVCAGVEADRARTSRLAFGDAVLGTVSTGMAALEWAPSTLGGVGSTSILQRLFGSDDHEQHARVEADAATDEERFTIDAAVAIAAYRAAAAAAAPSAEQLALRASPPPSDPAAFKDWVDEQTERADRPAVRAAASEARQAFDEHRPAYAVGC